jgi:hypothetical protein
VCIYGRYPAVETADGMLDCPNGGRLVQRECILYEESMIIPCSMTPAPSKQMDPSASSTPKPVISAKITIEIKTNITFTNTTTNMTVLEDPQVVYSLRDAISKALGVPVDLIVIEEIQFVKDGVMLTTVNVLNQGRRLSAVQNGYDIKYKIVDPPTSILNTPVEVLTGRIETSAALQSAALQTIEGMTGVALAPENLAIQSNEMAVFMPPQASTSGSGSETEAPQESKGSMYFMIGGICVAVGLVTVGAALLIAKRRHINRAHRIVETVYPLDKMDPVTIINPMPSTTVFFPAPRYFNESVRDVVRHGPQQVRRI